MSYQALIGLLFPSGPPENFAAHALVLPPATVQAMVQAQASLGSARYQVRPVPLVDGRWMICADILPELAPGGLFAVALPLFDMAAAAGVEVMDWVSAVALIARPVNLNDASEETLRSLSGVGPVLAAAIVAGRPWSDPSELAAIDGISPAMIAGWMTLPGLDL